MIPNIKEVIRGLQKTIAEKIEKAISTLMTRVQVKEVYEENGRLFIKATSLTNGREITQIKRISMHLGHAKGVIAYPATGDLGIVINLLGEYFYLGSVYDVYTAAQDDQLTKLKNSLVMINKSFGSYIIIHENEDIIVKTKSGSKIRLNEDGSFKLFNKENYGIEVGTDGKMALRGVEINHTQTKGTWPKL